MIAPLNPPSWLHQPTRAARPTPPDSGTRQADGSANDGRRVRARTGADLDEAVDALVAAVEAVTAATAALPGAAAAAAPLEHSMALGGPIARELVEGGAAAAAAAQLPPAAPVAVSMSTDVKVPLAFSKPAVLPHTVTTGTRQCIEHLRDHLHAVAAIDRHLCRNPSPGAFLDLKDVYKRLNAWTKTNFGGRGIKQGVVPALLSQVYGLEIPKQANYCWLCNVSPCTKANCGTHFDIVKVNRPHCHRVPGLSFI